MSQYYDHATVPLEEGDEVKVWAYAWGIRANKEPTLPNATQSGFIIGKGTELVQGMSLSVWYVMNNEGLVFSKPFFRPAILQVSQRARNLPFWEQLKIKIRCRLTWWRRGKNLMPYPGGGRR